MIAKTLSEYKKGNLKKAKITLFRWQKFFCSETSGILIALTSLNYSVSFLLC